MNYEAVNRTAPATPGLLNKLCAGCYSDVLCVVTCSGNIFPWQARKEADNRTVRTRRLLSSRSRKVLHDKNINQQTENNFLYFHNSIYIIYRGVFK